MSETVDWAKYVSEQEEHYKNILNKTTMIRLAPNKAQNQNSGGGNSSNDGGENEKQFSTAEASAMQKAIRIGLVDNKNDLEVQRKDPSSPLHSTKNFESLNLQRELLKGVYDMGFNAPSKIQEAALSVLLAEPPQNLIAQSAPSTGKTVAFVLAMLSRVNPKEKYPQVLCLLPTYELAVCTGEVAAKMGKFCPDIELRYAVRGEDIPRGTKLEEQVIIGTPGKVLDWAMRFKVFDLAKIRVFVLAEASVMIATQGHLDQVIRIHKNINKDICQMMFFSTTFDQDVMEFAEVIVRDPVIIRLKEEDLQNITHYYAKCANAQQKYSAVTNIYITLGVRQAIIFCQTCRTATWLSEKMAKDGHAVALLIGEESSVKQRISVIDRYINGQEKVLITTNYALYTGIRVDQVVVVNFDLPVGFDGQADCDTYVQRISRFRPLGKRGTVINLTDGPRSEAICRAIEAHFNKKIQRLVVWLNTEETDDMEKIGA